MFAFLYRGIDNKKQNRFAITKQGKIKFTRNGRKCVERKRRGQ